MRMRLLNDYNSIERICVRAMPAGRGCLELMAAWCHCGSVAAGRRPRARARCRGGCQARRSCQEGWGLRPRGRRAPQGRGPGLVRGQQPRAGCCLGVARSLQLFEAWLTQGNAILDVTRCQRPAPGCCGVAMRMGLVVRVCFSSACCCCCLSVCRIAAWKNKGAAPAEEPAAEEANPVAKFFGSLFN